MIYFNGRPIFLFMTVYNVEQNKIEKGGLNLEKKFLT